MPSNSERVCDNCGRYAPKHFGGICPSCIAGVGQEKPEDSVVMPVRQQFGEILAVLWEMVKRRPFLAFWPVLVYLRFFEKDLLAEWMDEAEQAVKGRVE